MSAGKGAGIGAVVGSVLGILAGPGRCRDWRRRRGSSRRPFLPLIRGSRTRAWGRSAWRRDREPLPSQQLPTMTSSERCSSRWPSKISARSSSNLAAELSAPARGEQKRGHRSALDRRARHQGNRRQRREHRSCGRSDYRRRGCLRGGWWATTDGAAYEIAGATAEGAAVEAGAITEEGAGCRRCRRPC